MQEGSSYVIRGAKKTDVEAIEKLLIEVDLNAGGVTDYLNSFLVAEQTGAIVGVIGSEVAGRAALLRSFGVTPAMRGKQVASRLVDALLRQLQLQCVDSVYLLTSTADVYFTKRGFYNIDRQDIPTSLVSDSVLA